MIITTEQLKQVAAGGGGLVIDATTMTFNQLMEVTVATKTGKAQMTVKNVSGLTAGQLAELAAAAPTLIVFDLTS